jgi:isopentenyl diphosphate isomerase/L-lactate dehydrogenase-like FMN-dependent dehydrogenase/phosphoribosylaminoimidazole carboxylase (NCAIR synthetase)
VSRHKTLVILGAGNLQKPLLDVSLQAGYKPVVFDAKDKDASTTFHYEYFNVSIDDPSTIINCLESAKIKPDLCATVGTDFTNTMAAINEYFHLAGISPKQAAVLQNKVEMRKFLRECGLPQPAFTNGTLKDKNHLYKWLNDNPCQKGFVIKPVDNMGARGVMFLPDERYLAYALEFAQKNSKCGQVILEHFVPARELSIDAFVKDEDVLIRGIADRDIEIRDEHFFIETGHTMPANDFDQVQKPIQELLSKIALGLKKLDKPYIGAIKLDLRITTNNELIVGEAAGRLSGGYMSTHTYPLASRINLLKEYLDLLSGKEIHTFPKEEYHNFAIERSISGYTGKITSSNLDSLLKEESSISHYNINFDKEDTVPPLQSNVGKIAHVILKAKSKADAERIWSSIQKKIDIKVVWPEYSDKELKRIARRKFNHAACWVCKECDGAHCASSVPGMGAIGKMYTFQDNINALKEFQLVPSYFKTETTSENSDCSWSFLGHQYQAPVLTAPISGSITNMGGSITEMDYARETAAACEFLNLLPTFGDGATEDKYWTGLLTIKKFKSGIPVFKPRASQDSLRKRIQAAKECGAIAWAMDIDGIHFKTMQLKNQVTARKSTTEIRELAVSSDLPFIIKGVMTVADAEQAGLAGASAIIVSNHGGRVLDDMPGTARVLPEIAAFVNDYFPQMQILVDGGVRSGQDVIKMLALGAHAVLIGRPITIAAVANGRFGVATYLNRVITELKQSMRVMGFSQLADINKEHIRQKEGTQAQHEKSTSP